MIKDFKILKFPKISKRFYSELKISKRFYSELPTLRKGLNLIIIINY